MIESHRKNQSHQNQYHEHACIARTDHQQKEADHQDHEFSYHYICEKRPNEENCDLNELSAAIGSN